MLNVLYLVHDLSDPAVRRRVIMLQAGGANVTLAGFRRGAPVADFEGLSPIELGRTKDGKFAQRIAEVARAACRLGGKLGGVRKPDVIIARTLEMLALANRANARFSGDVPVVYECLDIHRLLIRDDIIGRALRWSERRLARNAVLLLTSSPAFIREYFEPYQQFDMPVALLQNKVVDTSGFLGPVPGPADEAVATEPWVIGWFGALRCRKSLELLAGFTRHMDGQFKVVLRGRPAYSQFEDFDGFVAREPHMRFEGAYRNPEDLADIYGEVHFSWAIDFFEEGLNSSWLLPNRLYEGCRYGAVPIAMAETETGRFLSKHRLGILLPEASPSALATALGSLDARGYRGKRKAVEAQGSGFWVYDRDDCRALVLRLQGLCGTQPSGTMFPVVA